MRQGPSASRPGRRPDEAAAGGGEDVLAVVGVSYRDTPISLRERLSIAADETAAVLVKVRAVGGVREAVALSTCNRVELYACLGPEGGDAAAAATAAARAICEAGGACFEEVEPSLYRMHGLDAARHLFEVASGLDSMVPGENEILAQVKAAYRAALDAGAAGSELSRLFQRSLKVAKDVRSRTGISRRRVSVATVVSDLAGKVFGRLDRARALRRAQDAGTEPVEGARVALVGAGEMAELTLKALVSAGARVTAVANRSPEAARRLAETYGGEAVGLSEAASRLAGADVLVASAAAPGFIVSADDVEAAVAPRKGRPVLLVDLGVPRNIDPAAADLGGVILYNLDDLEGVVATNTAYRLEEAGKARALIEEEVAKYAALLREERAAGTIAELSGAMRRIGEEEARRALGRLRSSGLDLTPEQQEELGRMARRIVGKIIHPAIGAIKEDARAAGTPGSPPAGGSAQGHTARLSSPKSEGAGDGAGTERAARRLFGIGPAGGSAARRGSPAGPADLASPDGGPSAGDAPGAAGSGT